METLLTTYMNSSKDCVKRVAMVSAGVEVVLTRREMFDHMFKLIVTGKKDKVGICDTLSRVDRTLAKFYASEFLKITEVIDGGKYSFSWVRKYLRDAQISAFMSGVADRKYKLSYRDENGVLYILVSHRGKALYEFKIDSFDICIKSCVAIVSFIASDLEMEDDKEFIEDYLYTETERYRAGKGTQVYIDTRKHNLGEMLRAQRRAEKLDGEEKIVEFKAC